MDVLLHAVEDRGEEYLLSPVEVAAKDDRHIVFGENLCLTEKVVERLFKFEAFLSRPACHGQAISELPPESHIPGIGRLKLMHSGCSLGRDLAPEHRSVRIIVQLQNLDGLGPLTRRDD